MTGLYDKAAVSAHNVVIFDLDGTLADISRRRRHVENKPKNWKAFNDEMHTDVPNKPIVKLARFLSAAGNQIIVCSGREAVFREETMRWMQYHMIPCNGIWMRPAKDYRADDIVKSELLDQILDAGWRPWLVVDDRNRVVDMWRSRGLTCLQCAPGDF